MCVKSVKSATMLQSKLALQNTVATVNNMCSQRMHHNLRLPNKKVWIGIWELINHMLHGG